MNKFIIIVSFVFILLIIVGVIVYFFYEKPRIDKIESEQLKNLVLQFYDNGTQIRTGYIITLDNSNYVYLEENSTDVNYIINNIPANRSFSIFNKNIENQRYYTSYEDFNIYSSFNKKFNVYKIGDVNITITQKLRESDVIKVQITELGIVKCPKICVRGSTHIVSIKTNLPLAEAPLRLQDKVDKCFSLGEVLNKTDVYLSYSKFGNLLDSDSIKLYFIDGDITYYSYKECIDEGINGEDLGLDDKLYEIKY